MPPKQEPTVEIANQIIANLMTSKMSGKYPDITKWLIGVVKKYPKVRSVEVVFCGSGDNGAVEDVTYYDQDREFIKEADIEPSEELYDLISTHVSCNWMNDEGGGGSLDIDLIAMSIHVTSYYYEKTECDDSLVSFND